MKRSERVIRSNGRAVPLPLHRNTSGFLSQINDEPKDRSAKAITQQLSALHSCKRTGFDSDLPLSQLTRINSVQQKLKRSVPQSQIVATDVTVGNRKSLFLTLTFSLGVAVLTHPTFSLHALACTPFPNEKVLSLVWTSFTGSFVCLQ